MEILKSEDVVRVLFDTAYMHPADIFKYMLDYFHVSDVEHNITEKGTESWSFTFGDTSVPKSFFDSVKLYNKNVSNSQRAVSYKCSRAVVSYVISKKGNTSLCISQNNVVRQFNVSSAGYCIFFRNEIDVNAVVFHVYDKGKVWNYTKARKKTPSYENISHGFPCSMKDLFYYQEKQHALSHILYALFLYWGQKYVIWRDLAEDFKSGSSYCSIPLDLIFECRTRRELIQKYCGNDMKRNNRETIGKGLFLAKIRKYIRPSDYQMLFDYDVSSYFINRDKKTVVKPLIVFLSRTLHSVCPEMQVNSHGRVVRVTDGYIWDVINISFQLKKPLRLKFLSLTTFVDYHDALAIEQRNRAVRAFKIPSDSKFKNLRMPENCVPLVNRKQLVEEGTYNNNCVAGYGDRIAKDLCSIWSMRNDDGTRYTIEITVRDGHFYLHQMRGYGNSEVPAEARKKVRDCLKDQCVEK